ncbi:MAG: TlpA family protein disulfide reductase [Prevotella sp.]
MKKLSIIFITLLAALSSIQAQEKACVINGQWINPPAKNKGIGVYEIKNGICVPLATKALGNDGHFSISFIPEHEGFYAVAHEPKNHTFRNMFYFKPGDQLTFEMERDTYRLVGDNTPENIELTRWHDTVQPLAAKSFYSFYNNSTYEDFFPMLEEMLPTIKAYPKATTPNKKFNEAMESYKYYNLMNITLMFLHTPRTKHPKAADIPDFYRNIDMKRLTGDMSLLDYPGGLSMIIQAMYAQVRTREFKDEAESRAFFNRVNADYSQIVNDTLRGEYILGKAEYITTYPGVMTFKEKYGKYFVTADQQKRLSDIVAKFSPKGEATEPYQFTYTDINGKQVSLSDFKGKVVYIDIWATWCAPCRGEIPFMGKLEEEYADRKDMVFMSISVDNEKDHDKWMAMVKEKDMKGYQLFAGAGAADLRKANNITGIPRFILIGKDGKVIYSKAPRPSSDEIRAVLDEALK